MYNGKTTLLDKIKEFQIFMDAMREAGIHSFNIEYIKTYILDINYIMDFIIDTKNKIDILIAVFKLGETLLLSILIPYIVYRYIELSYWFIDNIVVKYSPFN